MTRLIKRLLPEIIGGTALLIAAEIIIRLVVPPVFIERGIWYNPTVAWKVLYLQQPEQLDLLFLGDSTVRDSLDPTRFDAEVKATTGKLIRSFNGGLSAADAGITSFYARKVYPLYAHPKAVLYAVGVGDLFEDNPNALAAKASFDASTMENALNDTGLLQSVNLWLLEHSMLFRIRGSVVQLFSDPLRWSTGDAQPFDEQGYQATSSRLPDASAAELTVMNDFFRSSLNHYQIDPSMVIQLDNMIEYEQAQGTKVYLVAMPAMPQLFTFLAHGRADYDSFVQALEAVSEKYGVPLMTFDPAHWADNFSENNYRDYWHMNDSGAQIFTRLVADWYTKQG